MAIESITSPACAKRKVDFKAILDILFSVLGTHQEYGGIDSLSDYIPFACIDSISMLRVFASTPALRKIFREQHDGKNGLITLSVPRTWSLLLS